MKQIGIQNLLIIFSHIFFIWIAFLAVQTLDWDKFLRPQVNNNLGKLLLIFTAITLGYSVSSFFISLVQAFQNLIFMF
ncbi:hypothetical protein JG29_10610 [Bombilactobacillus mellis]|uniref:DUF1146 domain-containing protein n=1 Tax=Bombilactobacillus mellis TaxID=1218508 RepID=A0A0F4KQH9_9LACO|nr:DUF1146 family protein [Bombilactobacillus mellis]MBI0107363.1 DUF1146 domain-containing protein [Lactobacillus sp. W8086]MBI0108828.1 DUF1146 domain-containing protein [Lactobacillus sp. W8085]MBI0112045.1 DUF1146 domain-containing protein [Lactobacillus sp. W8088]MBI0115761.1 DUF1146 domain-containing protein [Lactobacillus sp. W8087]MBI0119485.1 DUF1146 domain-containing protein [Lactobacillus sp. W8089]MBI0131451.1 DUF1146 domain-containing protein [Lactobacillus sp. W8090]